MAGGYYRMTCQIRVTRKDGSTIKFFQCVSIEIESSFDTLTDTATVTLPYDNRWKIKDANGFNQFRMISGNTEGFFSIGDEIQIFYGYDFKNNLEFDGYITEIDPRTPLKLICQDKSWELKKNRMNFTVTKPTFTLQEVAPQLLQGTGIEIHPQTWEQEIVLPGVSEHNVTAAQLLHKWRQSYGIISFMKDGKLCIGRSYFSSSAGIYSSSMSQGYRPPIFSATENVISQDLVLNSVDSDSIAIRASTISKDNKSLSVTLVKNPKNLNELVVAEVYDERLSKAENEAKQKRLTEQMEARGIFLENYTIKSHNEYGLDLDQLVEAAKTVFPKHYKSGLDGSFTTFGDMSLSGEYSIKPANTVIFLDSMSPEKNGEYLVKSVKKSWGPDGNRQQIEIPYKYKNVE